MVLVKEAAETLKAPIIAAYMPSLEYIILVSNYKQLRPYCQVKEYKGEPFNINMSLFKRIINNKVEFDNLRRQHRIIPKICCILKPIYRDCILDYPVIKDPKNRLLVKGIGGYNSAFFFVY